MMTMTPEPSLSKCLDSVSSQKHVVFDGNLFYQVPEYPKYCVSECGDVLSSCRKNLRVLKQGVASNGYPTVVLCNSSGKKTFCIHTIVLNTFVGECPEGCCCRHLDGNKLNSHADNLCWGTISDNELDKVDHGVSLRGERHPLNKLSVDDVIKIRVMLKLSVPVRIIADSFNVTRGAIYDIKKKRNWRWLND